MGEDVDEGEGLRERGNGNGNGHDRDRDCHDDRDQLPGRGLLFLLCRWRAQYLHDQTRDVRIRRGSPIPQRPETSVTHPTSLFLCSM